MGSYHHGNLRQALIDGAKELIAEVGPDGFTLRSLSRKVGVSHTAAYRHFADKEALLAAVAEEGFAGLGEAFDAVLAGISDPSEVLAKAGQAYVLYAVAHPANFRVMFQMARRAEDHPGLAEVSGRAYERLLGALRTAQEAGVVRPGPIEPLVLAAWSMVHGLARLIVDGTIRPELLGDPAEAARQATELLLNGLARSPEA